MKIISWNVNGIRACYKKGLTDFIADFEPEILCLQETKAEREQVEPEAQNLGYDLSFWSSAKKRGYSGTATFTAVKPLQTKLGLGIDQYDSEGRVVWNQFEKFDLYNIYFPNGGSGPERHEFKQRFLNDLNQHLSAQLESGKSIVVVGDYNVAHNELDVYDPVRLSKESGFLPEERRWFDEFLNLGFIDTFRHFHKDEKNRYSWWSYREVARPANRGWRIDYICVSKDLGKNLRSSEILEEVEGSDHCPVVCELDFR